MSFFSLKCLFRDTTTLHTHPAPAHNGREELMMTKVAATAGSSPSTCSLLPGLLPKKVWRKAEHQQAAHGTDKLPSCSTLIKRYLYAK